MIFKKTVLILSIVYLSGCGSSDDSPKIIETIEKPKINTEILSFEALDQSSCPDLPSVLVFGPDHFGGDLWEPGLKWSLAPNVDAVYIFDSSENSEEPVHVDTLIYEELTDSVFRIKPGCTYEGF